MYEITGNPGFLTFLNHLYEASQKRQGAPNRVTFVYIHLLTHN
jgi:hypothetical protein